APGDSNTHDRSRRPLGAGLARRLLGHTGGLMHAVIRRYRVRLGTVAQAVRYAEKQFVPLVRRIPGFVGCYLMDAGNDVLTSIGLFHTQEGAEAAISLQRDWFRDEWSSFRPLPPEIVAGAVLAAATAQGPVPAGRQGRACRRRSGAGGGPPPRPALSLAPFPLPTDGARRYLISTHVARPSPPAPRLAQPLARRSAASPRLLPAGGTALPAGGGPGRRARRRRRVRPRRPGERAHPARRAGAQPGRGHRRAGPLPRRARSRAAAQTPDPVTCYAHASRTGGGPGRLRAGSR